MATGDFEAGGNETIEASNPGVVASKEVTISTGSIDANSKILVNPTTELPWDAWGQHALWEDKSARTTTTFTVKSSRRELPMDVNFDYVVFE